MEEVLELLFGEHGVDDLEYRAAVVLVELVNEFYALKLRFILQGNLPGQLPFIVEYLI
ncbi:hypothetical protein [Lunatimonas salinarum]|uniref:hypothetical protein n=1 Tax=Lunatimonas salinarum TaxID=1774590 RepID=UPI001ADFCF91|nr:hypothetical protein [Lunatimonas salinarum]